MNTTIRVSLEVKRRLEKLRAYPREPLNGVLERLTELAVDDEPLSKRTLEEIESALKDLREGRLRTTERVVKELGL